MAAVPARGGFDLLSKLPGEGRQRLFVLILLILAIGYPFFYSSGFVSSGGVATGWMPTINNLIVMAYYAVLALGLNIVVGFAGLLDLGYVAFYVFGAYSTAFLASPIFDLHVSWWLVVIVAVIVAAIAGILLGAPTLRLRGDYLAIVTLGFGEIVPQLVRNLDEVNINILGVQVVGPDFNLTGGPIGINPIDPPTLPLPEFLGGEIVFSNGNPHASFYLALVMLVGVFLVCRRLRDSRLGRAWMAVREDETAAASMGINTVSTKLLAFALGASFSGFVGAFVGAYQTAIFPESFSFNVSISILIMVILGGMGSIRGVIIGAFILVYLSQTFLPWLSQFVNSPVNSFGRSTGIGFLADFQLVSLNFLVYGIILVLMMIYRPEGLLPAAAAKAELHGEGIAAESTFGTDTDVAGAATDYEESTGDLGTSIAEMSDPIDAPPAERGDAPPGDKP
jgi:branched-chain amino acid transport system permease protein